jgi:hypothetical protein
MPTSLLTFKTNLYGPLGRNDAVAAGFITRGVNFACTLIALLYDPPELQASATATINAGTVTESLAAYTRIANITKIYNTSGVNKVWMLSDDIIDFVQPLTTAQVKYFKFFSRDGMTLNFRPLSTLTNVLTISYNQYPLVVADDGDEISFSNFDSIVESYALAYAMACLEEGESSAMWQKLGEQIGIQQQILLKTRIYLEGGPAHGNNPKGVTA